MLTSKLAEAHQKLKKTQDELTMAKERDEVMTSQRSLNTFYTTFNLY